MRSVAAGGGRKAVVANGAEGEPASRKDRLLLTRLPHLVLDGITLAAQAVGADEAYLCVHGTEGALLDRLDHALEERQAAGLDPVPIQVAGLPGRYVSSEQSSIVQYLNGGPAKPTFSPPRPHERGVNGKPTLVHNVETLAHLALIARHGDRWFRGAGLPSAPGSMLVTVSGAVSRPGVYEIEMGTPAGQVMMLAGGPAEPLQALLVGGYFGAWLPVEAAWTVPMTHAGLKAVGGALGAGIVIALPAAACPIAETARVVRYLAEESAGQCGPCLFGLPALADALANLAYSGGRERDRHRRHRRADPAHRGPWRLPAPRRGHATGAQPAHGVPGGRALASVAGRLRRRAAAAAAAAARRRGKGLGLAMTFTLRVNPIACTGHGMCAELLPEVIELDRWGYPILASPVVPRSLLNHARRAAAGLPHPGPAHRGEDRQAPVSPDARDSVPLLVGAAAAGVDIGRGGRRTAPRRPGRTPPSSPSSRWS